MAAALDAILLSQPLPLAQRFLGAVGVKTLARLPHPDCFPENTRRGQFLV